MNIPEPKPHELESIDALIDEAHELDFWISLARREKLLREQAEAQLKVFRLVASVFVIAATAVLGLVLGMRLSGVVHP